MARGFVLNIQRYCLHDGPGIRTTVFLQGCPLNCAWCHNPESQPQKPPIRVIETRCVRCGRCAVACPQNGASRVSPAARALRGADDTDRRLPSSDCSRCGACVSACPLAAREMPGREMSVQEVVQEVMRDRLFHEQSGGGVTISGGEPLLQPEFLTALLREFRTASIHSAIDTSGFAPESVIQQSAPLADLFLYDIKCVDERRHRRWTGVSNTPVLSNLRTLASIHDTIWMRIPLIPEFNLREAELTAAAQLAASYQAVRQVNLLPYHRMGTGKAGGETSAAAERAGMAAPPQVATEQLEWAAGIFRAAGIHTVVGG